MKYEIDCLVIGAGVIGIAIARELQLAGREVFLVERERSFGMETSSRNSEVIHAGIYYPPGGLKAELCVEGKALLYEYCKQHGVPHKNPGKIIVAIDQAEVSVLEKYKETAEANGVSDLQWLDAKEVNELEPEVLAVKGLLSPSTGIIDSHAFMQALMNDFEQAGGMFIRKAPVLGGRVVSQGIELRLGDEEGTVLKARTVVNSAGLYACDLARSIEGMPLEHVPTARYAIGHYFMLAGKSPFKRLVYPVARAGGLGVHVTLDMSGAVRFGPDVSWRDGVDYSFDESRAKSFLDAIRTYFPAISSEVLVPGYTGIRPKISGPEDPNKDFVIQREDVHGVPGLINLFGIESPGLTSSLALARNVADFV